MITVGVREMTIRKEGLTSACIVLRLEKLKGMTRVIAVLAVALVAVVIVVVVVERGPVDRRRLLCIYLVAVSSELRNGRFAIE